MPLHIDPTACLARLASLVAASPEDARLRRAMAWMLAEIVAQPVDVEAA